MRLSALKAKAGRLMKFDHLVISCTRLADGVAYAEERLGAALEAGGQHARYGTHNALLGLENGAYLEVIAIDPDAPAPPRARWFGLDDFAGAPRLTNWVCQAEDMERVWPELPRGFERIADLARGDLRWKMAEAAEGRLPFGGCFPGVIDWGESPHPSTRLAPSGITLEWLELRHPEADALAQALGAATGMNLAVVQGAEPALRAGLSGADGREIVL